MNAIQTISPSEYRNVETELTKSERRKLAYVKFMSWLLDEPVEAVAIALKSEPAVIAAAARLQGS